MFPLVSLINWRVWLAATLLCLGGVGGWRLNAFLHPSQSALAPETRTVVVDRIITKTVTITKRPDGTVIEETSETTSDHSSNTSKPTPVPRPQWSVGALASVAPRYPVPRPEWSVVAYRRLGDTNAWAGGGWDFEKKSALLGVRIDF